MVIINKLVIRHVSIVSETWAGSETFEIINNAAPVTNSSKGTFRALRSAAMGLVEFSTMLARAGLVLSVVHSSATKMQLQTTTPSATPPPLQLDVH